MPYDDDSDASMEEESDFDFDDDDDEVFETKAPAKKTTTKKAPAKAPAKKAPAKKVSAKPASKKAVIGVDESEDEDDFVQEDTTNKPKKTVEQIYQKKTQLEHILLRPDTYSKLNCCLVVC